MSNPSAEVASVQAVWSVLGCQEVTAKVTMMINLERPCPLLKCHCDFEKTQAIFYVTFASVEPSP